jgi:hypothetical protein
LGLGSYLVPLSLVTLSVYVDPRSMENSDLG